MSFVNYNGRLISENQSFLTADNRAFRYGEGLFETMLVRSDGVRLGPFHWERLLRGMGLLRLAIPSTFTYDDLERQVLALYAANGHTEACRARMTVWREEAAIGYVIQTGPLPLGAVSVSEGSVSAGSAGQVPLGAVSLGPAGWNAEGLRIDVFPDGRKACDVYATLKSNNYLLYSMAALDARRQGLDDCLVLNSHERLADSSIANLFYIKDHRFYTPPLSEGCVAGVMRRYLLEALPRVGYTVQEQPVSPEDLAGADEVFLTNALRGIRWVRAFRSATYGNRLATAVHEQIIQKL